MLTTGGEIELMRLREFFKRIPRTKVYAEMMFYNTRVSVEAPFAATDADGVAWEEATYERRAVRLQHGDEFQILLSALISYFSFRFSPKVPPAQFAEDLVIAHLEMWGSGQHLVRLAPRRWAVLDPEDFLIYEGPFGIALICSCQARAVAFERFPYTQEKLDAIAEAIMAKRYT